MGQWREAFVSELRKVGGMREVRYLIDSLDAPGSDLGGLIQLSSHPGYGFFSPVIARSGHSFSGGRVTPGEWSSTVAQARIMLTSDIRSLPGKVAARGQLVQLKVGFAGWSTTDFEPILTGFVSQIGQSGEAWYIEIRSIIAALTSRQSLTAGELALFYEFPNVATAISPTAYVAGDALLRVLALDTAQRETGGNYGALVTGNSGAQFWLTATGTAVAPLRFTGCSSSAALDTIAENANIGNAVEQGWCVESHPVDAIRKFVCSTGLGTNGTFDTLPESWGLGLPDAAIDHDDCEQTISVAKPATGSIDWTFLGTEPIVDPLSWFNGWLQPAGFFLADYQGRMSVRAAVPSDSLNYDGSIVSDADIVSLDSYETWNPDQPAEYATMWGQIPGTPWTLTASTEAVLTRPAIDEMSFVLDKINDNKSAWLTDVHSRRSTWNQRIGEQITLTLAGWRFAHLGPGSHILISSKFIGSRSKLSGVAWLVISCEPDWFGATTRVTAVHIPEAESGI